MLTDDEFLRSSRLIVERLGLNFSTSRRRELESGLRQAARGLGFGSTEKLLRRLFSSNLNRRLFDEIAPYLTIGETYFLRHPQAIATLEELVLPRLLHERRHSRRVSIWSAGCSTGEEPYSLAILLDRLLPDQSRWEISILGTDVDEPALKKAAAGLYGDWSFRDAPAWLINNYFSRRQDKYELIPEIRNRVTFNKLNLVTDDYPGTETTGFDLILCRNVMMYFSDAKAEKVVQHLHDALVEDGWLLTSAAEAWGNRFSAFERVPSYCASLFRKTSLRQETQAPVYDELPPKVPPLRKRSLTRRGHGSPPERSGTPGPRAIRLPDSRASSDGLSRAVSIRRSAGSQAPFPTTPSCESSGRQADVLGNKARGYANAGRLNEAGEFCREAVKLNPSDVTYRYLLATVELERGRLQEAARALNQAIYLDPSVALAHFVLGNLRRSQGRTEEARRHFGNALRQLRDRPADDPVPLGEGLTTGELVAMIESITARSTVSPEAERHLGTKATKR